MLTPFEMAFVAHLFADWILQNDWMALNKSNLLHPAAWIHSGIHGVLLGIILGWPAGIVLGITHALIDTRVPIRWWSRIYGKTCNGEIGMFLATWFDQVLHIVVIALWIGIVGVA